VSEQIGNALFDGKVRILEPVWLLRSAILGPRRECECGDKNKTESGFSHGRGCPV
jgi:hypothetical protein